MKAFEEININLDLPPSERWRFLQNYQPEVDVLIGYYLRDLGDVSFFQDAIDYYKQTCISKEYLDEIRCIASFSAYSENEVLITNLYYDALKFVFGCTAFCIHASGQTLHARNLDWWTENNALNTHTKLFHFTRGGQVLYSAVSWIGFVGILSGMKPQAFSITLNSVFSSEAPHLAPPITFLIRETLEKATSFEEARQMLSQTDIASDCLLMLAGTGANERAVIERTPRKASIRTAEKGYMVVTNNYLTLTQNVQKEENLLQESSCERFNRTTELLEQHTPQSADECFHILNDDRVKMGITVQQMVFNLAIGKVTLY